MQAILLATLFILVKTSWEMTTYHSCTCAAVGSTNVTKDGVLLERSIDVLPSCEAESCTMCSDLCRTLIKTNFSSAYQLGYRTIEGGMRMNEANTTRDDPEGGNNFCHDVNKDIRDVYISVFSKTCDHDYTYTGFTFDQPTCCLQGKRVDCKTPASNITTA